MELVDSKNWQAIIAVEENGNGNGNGNPEMSFGTAVVYDKTSGLDHKSRDGFPVVIPEGHEVAVSYLTQNTGDATIRVRNQIEFVDPTNVVLSSLWEPSSGYFTVSPDTFMTSKKTPYFTLDKTGIWLIHGLIEIEDVGTVEYTWQAINVQETPPEKYVCPYSCATFDTYAEWLAHMKEVHGEEPPPGEGSDLLKYALIGGGIILVAVVATPLIKRKP